jgi:carbamoyl-phosphate synthase L subunit-like protein
MGFKILIATTYRWFSTTRLVIAFADAGCVVMVVHPTGHFVDHMRSLSKSYPYSGLSPLASFRTAIVSARPDFVIPADDTAMLHLHRLHESEIRTNAADSRLILEVIEKSIGDPLYYPLVESRSEVAAIARSEGIATPDTSCVLSEGQVKAWLKEHGAPAVLKADGTSGGEGVRIVGTQKEALRAFRTLRAPRGVHIVAKRAFIDRETNLIISWALRRKRTVSIQSFVRGHDANITLACWQGKVLASISAEVVRTTKLKGPASLVRVLPDGLMLRAAEKIVDRLKMSGLCGLDFVIDDQTNSTNFIEVNARSTQTCHLALGNGRNPVASLCAVLANVPLPDMPAMTKKNMIAIFPSAWFGHPTCKFFHTAYHDVPWEEPGLVRAGLAEPSKYTYETWLKFWLKVCPRVSKIFP